MGTKGGVHASWQHTTLTCGSLAASTCPHRAGQPTGRLSQHRELQHTQHRCAVRDAAPPAKTAARQPQDHRQSPGICSDTMKVPEGSGRSGSKSGRSLWTSRGSWLGNSPTAVQRRKLDRIILGSSGCMELAAPTPLLFSLVVPMLLLAGVYIFFAAAEPLPAELPISSAARKTSGVNPGSGGTFAQWGSPLGQTAHRVWARGVRLDELLSWGAVEACEALAAYSEQAEGDAREALFSMLPALINVALGSCAKPAPIPQSSLI